MKNIGFRITARTTNAGMPKQFAVCRQCYGRSWGCNGHRVPRPITRKMLGIEDITAQTARANDVCHNCHKAIGA